MRHSDENVGECLLSSEGSECIFNDFLSNGIDINGFEWNFSRLKNLFSALTEGIVRLDPHRHLSLLDNLQNVVLNVVFHFASLRYAPNLRCIDQVRCNSVEDE